MFSYFKLVNVLVFLYFFGTFLTSLLFLSNAVDSSCAEKKNDYVFLLIMGLAVSGCVVSANQFRCCFSPFQLEDAWRCYMSFKSSIMLFSLMFAAWVIQASLKDKFCSAQAFWFVQSTILCCGFLILLSFHAFLGEMGKGVDMKSLYEKIQSG